VTAAPAGATASTVTAPAAGATSSFFSFHHMHRGRREIRNGVLER